MASTGSHHHVLVLLQDHVGVVVEVEHGDGVQLRRGAAGFGDILRVHEMDQCLHNGVVGGIHVGIKGEGALSITVVGSISLWCNNPVLPAQLPEADIQLVLSASCLLVAAVVL